MYKKYCDGLDCAMCGESEPCIYREANELQKQVETLEQECEELKADEKSLLNVIDDLQKTKNEWQEKYNDLGQDFDQLKAENDTLRQFLHKELLVLQALQSAYFSYKKNADVFYEMVKQYKQTLTEIKEIAERDKLFCDKYDGDIEIDCVNCHEGGRALLAKEIIQKISDVENEYNTKDIRHINEKNKEYIAEGNRMTKNN